MAMDTGNGLYVMGVVLATGAVYQPASEKLGIYLSRQFGGLSRSLLLPDKAAGIVIAVGISLISYLVFGYGGIGAGAIVGLRIGFGLVKGRSDLANRKQKKAYLRDIGQLERLVELGVDFTTAVCQVGESNQGSATLRRIASRIRSGFDVEEALTREQCLSKTDFPGLGLLAQLVPALLVTGAPIVPVLRQIVRHAESVEELSSKKQTLAAQGRMQARVMLALPVVLLPILMAMDSRISHFYNQSFFGAIVLAFASLVLVFAYGWMQKIVGDGS